MGRVILAHDDSGTGPPLVLIHAGIADRTMWTDHIGPLAGAGYRVIAVDLPSFGDSPAAQVAADWTDVLETMDALGVERAAIVGVSFGAAVALRIAAVAPARVSALVLTSTPVPGADPSDRLAAIWRAEGEAIDRGDIAAAVTTILDGWLLPNAPAALRDRVARMQHRAFDIQLAAGDPAEAPDPLADPTALGEIQAPALVITGAEDLPDFRTDAIERALPNARGLELADAGHLAPLETPEAFRSAVLEFLADVAP